MIIASFKGVVGSTPPAPSVAEHTVQLEERVRSPTSLGSVCVHDPQRGDVPPVAPVVSPQAGGHSHSWADRGSTGLAPALVDMRGHGL